MKCDWCDKHALEDKKYCGGDYCTIQNTCKGGWVFPDRCRYIRHLGCDCGAYPGER